MKKYTYSAKQSDNEGRWCVIDASGAILGRLASKVASHLQGKHNPLYTPHVDTGDWIIVINADKVMLTGRKMDQKNYYRHSGYIGGLTTTTARELKDKGLKIWYDLPSRGCCRKTGWAANNSGN